MRKEIFLVTAGAVLFNIIFWEEKLGLNAMLFDLFIIGAISKIELERRMHKLLYRNLKEAQARISRKAAAVLLAFLELRGSFG